MKKIIFVIMCLSLAGCGATRKAMRNCSLIHDQEKIYDCEEL